MYLITIIFIFVFLFIVFVDCGIFPALQTKNYLGIFIQVPFQKIYFYLFLAPPQLKTSINNNSNPHSFPFPSLKTKNNPPKIFSLKINSSETKNKFKNLNKFPSIFPKNFKKSKISSSCWNNNNYPTEEEGEDKEDYPSHSFLNKSNKIAKILVWEFQLYKLNEKLEGTNDWGQQLNKEERANVILISELFSWLTLKEHLNVNLKKAVGLLIALRESDRILQNANFLCSVFNYLKRIEGEKEEEKELLNRWTLDELKINFWNVLEIEEVFIGIMYLEEIFK
ncbi:unnamed protein product [Meloidogyne enterolobii]|uniref:Uncharacterized protein n=1 Tax=Meloidogyne enterolobii TaxID=390850 RepID=A0ACB0YAB6_MELEN